MPSFRIESPFPIKGKSEVVSYREQPALTSRETENMRGISPKDGRVKGAKRAGFTKWNSGVVNSGAASGSEKVQFLDYVVTDDRLLTYSAIANASVTHEWEIETPGANDCNGIAVDARGVIYILDGDTQWAQINPAGSVIYKRNIPAASGTCRAIAVDTNYDVYIGMSSGGTQSDARLYRYRAEPDGTYTLAWEKALSDPSSSNVSYIADIALRSGQLYVLTNDGSGTVSGCHVFDAPRTSVAPTASVTFSTQHQALGIAVNDAGEIFVAATEPVAAPNMDQWLTKYDSQGTEIWEIESQNGQTHVPGATTTTYHPGGIGLGVAINSEGDIYTTGNPSTGTDQDAHFCKIVDDGTAPNMDPSGSTYWEVSLGAIYFTFAYRRVAVDSFDNVYYAGDLDDATVGQQILAYAKDGSSGAPTNILTYPPSPGADQRDRGQAVALPPAGETPEYQSGGPTRAEFVYLAQRTKNTDNENVEKVRLVSVASSTGSNRNIQVLAAADGDVMKIASGSGGGTAPGGSNTLSKPELETDPQLVQTASAFGKLFMVDGVNSLYYDPTTDEVLKWSATDPGRVPPRCKLLTFWRGRAMLARDPDNANAWHASKLANPFHWEFLPKIISQTQAMTSSLTDGPGEVPDIINAMVPYNRDFLLFGCDHTLFMMRGDPAAGGQIELVSDITGMSLGSPWTKDPQGALYFFGSKGGVYRWLPEGVPVRISEMAIDRELFDLDLDNHQIAMEWSHREDGLRIVQLPFGDGGSEVNAYFWERKTDGWHVDTLDNTDHNPTAIMSMDGDAASDRVILYGCEDGYVRYVDEASFSDDGQKIDGHVLYGPYFDPEGHTLCVDMFQVELDRTGSGARFEWYTTESVDDPISAPVWSGNLVAGRNRWMRGEARGPYLWLKLVNATAGDYFGIENVDVRVMRSGLVEVS